MEREIAKLFKQAWVVILSQNAQALHSGTMYLISERNNKIDAERQSAEEHSLLYQNVWKLQDY